MKNMNIVFQQIPFDSLYRPSGLVTTQYQTQAPLNAFLEYHRVIMSIFSSLFLVGHNKKTFTLSRSKDVWNETRKYAT